MVARTITKAIRSTSLGEWSLLLRETLQNSVDARVDDEAAVHFHVGFQDLDDNALRVLREETFADLPAKQLPGLSAALKGRSLTVLYIADSNTRGLGGPTRADVETDERANFRDFFLNVGREEAKGYGGGTFGLGRGVLFDISTTGTLVAFTRTWDGNRRVSRLIAMAISDTYTKNRKRYTGRHWWGGGDQTDRPEPVTGRTAERLAGQLGLADRILPDTTGTALMVIGPRIPTDYEVEDVLDQMIVATRLYGWPLMVRCGPRPPINFEFGLNDDRWEPQDPEHHDSPVRHFVEAYRVAVDGAGHGPTSWHNAPVTFKAGQARSQVLGQLAFRHLPPSAKPAQQDWEEDRIIPDCSIALMRAPRMIVRYLPVPKHPQGATTVGVFVADPAMDRSFAESEPVAHDDWLPERLATAKFQRNPIRQTLDKIKQAVKDSTKVHLPQVGGPDGADALAPVIGDLLGGMVADTPGFGGGGTTVAVSEPKEQSGGGKNPSAQGGRRGDSDSSAKGALPRRSSVVVDDPVLVIDNGDLLARFPVRVAVSATSSAVVLTARTGVVSESRREDSEPEKAAVPEFVGWEDPAGASRGTKPELRLAATSDLVACVRQPADTVIFLDVTVEDQKAQGAA